MSLVEYYDPDGLFPLISTQLHRLLPLRNLHWKSSSRPLRSISSLRVEFVPSAATGVASESKPSGTNNASQQGAASKRGQRHQLPGLRSTPYLKIYLLRCDDKEGYKSTRRKALREWLGESISSSQSSSGHKPDRHDASEWLILLVVFPSTPVAAEQRSRPIESDGEASGDKRSGNARWPGRPPKTLLEKLKSDFNQPGKSSPDRIAQVRLAKDAQPPEFMPPSPTTSAATTKESAPEHENLWNDLTLKLKNLILMSFDARVSQYEEDIREKEAQRSLPGWNFCTFFVLKEGLARSFESVGLAEDALACYDELSAGLDLFLNQQPGSGTKGASDALLAYTNDMRFVLLRTLGRQDDNGDERLCQSRFSHPFDAIQKPFREMIASNNISLFDFRCYLFSRQLELYPHLIWPSSPQRMSAEEIKPAASPKKTEANVEIENPDFLAKLSQTATETMHSLARLLRSDLWESVTGSDESQNTIEQAIDTIVDIWSYSATEQLLQEVKSTQFSDRSPLSATMISESEGGEDRLSALGISFQSHPTKPANPSKENATSQKPLRHLSHEGLGSAAAHRAEFCLLQRGVLERIGRQCGVSCGVTAKPISTTKMDTESEEVNHNINESKRVSWDDTFLGSFPFFNELALSKVLGSGEGARRHCFELTNQAALLYSQSKRSKSADQLLVDIAIFKYHDGDYAAAASLLGNIATTFARRRWDEMEIGVLAFYADCLKTLNRKAEHIRVVMDIISKKVELSKTPSQSTKTPSTRSSNTLWMAERASTDTPELLTEVVLYAAQLHYDFTVPLKKYFSNIHWDSHITLIHDRDGFKLGMELGQFLNFDLKVDSMRVRLVDADDRRGREIWLQSDAPCSISQSRSRIWLTSNVSTVGSFVMDKILVHLGKIVFTCDLHGKSEAASPLILSTSDTAAARPSDTGSLIFCHSRPDSFFATVIAAPTVHIGRFKGIKINIDTGSNHIKGGHFSLRAVSAGLRLRTVDAIIDERAPISRNKTKPGTLELKELSKHSVIDFVVPFDLDQNVTNISVRFEAFYTTEHGDFVFFRQSNDDVELLLDVNVQDMIKEDAILSKFLFRPIHPEWIRMKSASLSGSETLNVQEAGGSFTDQVIAPANPVSIHYLISFKDRPEGSHERGAKQEGSLTLSVEYIRIADQKKSRIIATFDQALKDTNVWPFRRLLTQALAENTQKSLLQSNRLAETTSEDFVPSYDQLDLAGMRDVLPQSLADDFGQWSREWHAKLADCQLDPAEPELEPRHLIIDLEIPQVHFLHTACLRPLGSKPIISSASPPVTVGNPVSAELAIRYTRKWDTSSSASDLDKPVEFHYEIYAEPSTWLVLGQGYGSFTARPGEKQAFPVILIPLKAGFAKLPTVDITPVEADAQENSMTIVSGKGQSTHSGGLYCETDCVSRHEGVQVIDGVQNTTVGVGGKGSLEGGVEILCSDARH